MTRLFKVESGVEINSFYLAQHKKYLGRNRYKNIIYPFEKMEIGDSFLVPPSRNVKSVRTAAIAYGYRHNKQFIVTYDNEMRLRCWRMS